MSRLGPHGGERPLDSTEMPGAARVTAVAEKNHNTNNRRALLGRLCIAIRVANGHPGQRKMGRGGV